MPTVTHILESFLATPTCMAITVDTLSWQLRFSLLNNCLTAHKGPTATVTKQPPSFFAAPLFKEQRRRNDKCCHIKKKIPHYQVHLDLLSLPEFLANVQKENWKLDCALLLVLLQMSELRLANARISCVREALSWVLLTDSAVI